MTYRKTLGAVVAAAFCIIAAPAAVASSAGHPAMVKDAEIAADVVATWPKVQDVLTTYCTEMPKVYIQGYTKMAAKLAQKEKVPNADRDAAVAAFTDTIQQTTKLLTDAVHSFQGEQMPRNEWAVEFVTTMNKIGTLCAGTHAEIQLMLPAAMRFLDEKDYAKALAGSDFVTRLLEVQQKVVRDDPAKYPTLAKQL